MDELSIAIGVLSIIVAIITTIIGMKKSYPKFKLTTNIVNDSVIESGAIIAQAGKNVNISSNNTYNVYTQNDFTQYDIYSGITSSEIVTLSNIKTGKIKLLFNNISEGKNDTNRLIELGLIGHDKYTLIIRQICSISIFMLSVKILMPLMKSIFYEVSIGKIFWLFVLVILFILIATFIREIIRQKFMKLTREGECYINYVENN